MFKKIIWASDGSEAADHALEFARALTVESDGEMLAIHCREVSGVRGGLYPVHLNQDELEAKIRGQVADLSAAGIKASSERATVGVGGAAHAIAEAARAWDTEVIVVGTHGNTPLAGLLLDSVTQRLLHIAPCPVLAVPRTSGAGQ